MPPVRDPSTLMTLSSYSNGACIHDAFCFVLLVSFVNDRLGAIIVGKDALSAGTYGAADYTYNTCPTTKTSVAATIPTFFDARNAWPGCISPILDQGHCGSCWAYATAQTLTDRLCIAGRAANRTIERLLSPQQHISCDHTCVVPSTQVGCNDGCNGGTLVASWFYTASVGLVGATCIPATSAYTGVSGTCPALDANGVPTCSASCADSNSPVACNNTAFKSGPCYYITKVAAMQTEIMTRGTLMAGMVAYDDFLSYESGIYVRNPDSPAYGGHAVRIIGWGTSSSGVDYWIIANQWSEDWGIGGYAYIRRGTNEATLEDNIIAADALVSSYSQYEDYSYVSSSPSLFFHMHRVLILIMVSIVSIFLHVLLLVT